MDFLEKDLEQIIYDADKVLLAERGLILTGIIKRQLRIGNYGIADLVTFKRKRSYIKNEEPILIITVYELKKDNIGISTFLQALGYQQGIELYLAQRNFSHKIKFKIVLIGKYIDKNSNFVYLPNFIRNVECYTYSYNIDGILFNQENGYHLSDNGFKLKK